MFFDNNARNIEVKDYSLRILKIAGSIFQHPYGAEQLVRLWNRTSIRGAGSGQKKGEYAVRKCPNGN